MLAHLLKVAMLAQHCITIFTSQNLSDSSEIMVSWGIVISDELLLLCTLVLPDLRSQVGSISLFLYSSLVILCCHFLLSFGYLLSHFSLCLSLLLTCSLLLGGDSFWVLVPHDLVEVLLVSHDLLFCFILHLLHLIHWDKTGRERSDSLNFMIFLRMINILLVLEIVLGVVTLTSNHLVTGVALKFKAIGHLLFSNIFISLSFSLIISLHHLILKVVLVIVFLLFDHMMVLLFECLLFLLQSERLPFVRFIFVMTVPLILFPSFEIVNGWFCFNTSLILFWQLSALLISQLLLNVVQFLLLLRYLSRSVLLLLIFLLLVQTVVFSHDSFILSLLLLELLSDSSLHLNLLLWRDVARRQGSSSIKFIVLLSLIDLLLMLEEVGVGVSLISDHLVSCVTFEDQTFSVVKLITLLLLFLFSALVVDLSLEIQRIAVVVPLFSSHLLLLTFTLSHLVVKSDWLILVGMISNLLSPLGILDLLSSIDFLIHSLIFESFLSSLPLSFSFHLCTSVSHVLSLLSHLLLFSCFGWRVLIVDLISVGTAHAVLVADRLSNNFVHKVLVISCQLGSCFSFARLLWVESLALRSTAVIFNRSSCLSKGDLCCRRVCTDRWLVLGCCKGVGFERCGISVHVDLRA